MSRTKEDKSIWHDMNVFDIVLAFCLSVLGLGALVMVVLMIILLIKEL